MCTGLVFCITLYYTNHRYDVMLLTLGVIYLLLLSRIEYTPLEQTYFIHVSHNTLSTERVKIIQYRQILLKSVENLLVLIILIVIIVIVMEEVE